MRGDAFGPSHMVFAAATATTIVGQLGLVFAPFLVLLAMRQTGLDDASASRIIASEFIAYLVTALIASSTRRFHHSRIALFASGAYAAGSLAAALATDPGVFTAARILCGIGGGAVMVSANRLIASHLNYDRLFATAIIGTAVFAIAGLLIVPAILQYLGSTAAYMALGTLGIFAALLSSFMIPGSRVPERNGMNFGLAPWIMLAAYFLSRLCDALLWPYIERFGESVGMDTTAVGIVLSGATVVAIAGPLIALRVHCLYGLMLLFATALLAKSIAPLLMAALPNVAVFVASQLVVSFSLVLAGQLFLTHFSAVDASGRLAGLGGTVGLLADAGGVVLSNEAYAAGGYSGVATSSAAAGLLAIILCLPALFAWMRPARQRAAAR